MYVVILRLLTINKNTKLLQIYTHTTVTYITLSSLTSYKRAYPNHNKHKTRDPKPKTPAKQNIPDEEEEGGMGGERIEQG